MEKMLEGIRVILNCDYLKHRNDLKPHKLLIFTGPIDEYFNFEIGKLKYRGQRREQEYLAGIDWAQPCVQVNNPSSESGKHIRTIEWKHLLTRDEARGVRGTVLTRETTITPSDPNDYEYPFPDESNAKLYKSYAKLARVIPDLMICGRLGEYRYYDMDQAIARAHVLADRIISRVRLGEGAVVNS
jgi:UDP-galactopyranose mutase